MSKVGLWVAGIYFVAAACVAIEGLGNSSPGGWTSMKMMWTFFVTSPVSVPLSMMGMEPKLENPFVCGLMVLLTAGVVYAVVAGIGWVWGRIW